MSFIDFWLACLRDGWGAGYGTFAIIDATVVLIATAFTLRKKARSGWEEVVRQVALVGGIGVLVVATFIIAPYRRHQETGETFDRLHQTNTSLLRRIADNAAPKETHDVVAKATRTVFLTKELSMIDTNGELYVDLALINKGNQTEIIRDAFLCCSQTTNLDRASRWVGSPRNLKLPKGDMRVLHLTAPRDMVFGKGQMWLGIGVIAIAPNGDEIETVWPVSEIEIAADGNGGRLSYDQDKAPLAQVVSNRRMPHQKPAMQWP